MNDHNSWQAALAKVRTAGRDAATTYADKLRTVDPFDTASAISAWNFTTGNLRNFVAELVEDADPVAADLAVREALAAFGGRMREINEGNGG